MHVIMSYSVTVYWDYPRMREPWEAGRGRDRALEGLSIFPGDLRHKTRQQMLSVSGELQKAVPTLCPRVLRC